MVQVQLFGIFTRYGLEILKSVAKELKLKARKVGELMLTFLEVARKKLVEGGGGGTFCPILIRVKVWVLPFIHININSILPKIEELRCVACLSNAAVIRISESKLYNSIFDSEIEFDSYNILRFYRNRHRT